MSCVDGKGQWRAEPETPGVVVAGVCDVWYVCVDIGDVCVVVLPTWGGEPSPVLSHQRSCAGCATNGSLRQALNAVPVLGDVHDGHTRDLQYTRQQQGCSDTIYKKLLRPRVSWPGTINTLQLWPAQRSRVS